MNNKEQKRVIVIGGGPAGLVSAAAAARAGAAVTLLEGMRRPGRKLLMTGNGRCNISSARPDPAEVYASFEHAAAPECVRAVFSRFGVPETLAFFEEIGVPVRAEGELLYPSSGQASAVLDALLRELAQLRVKTKYNAKVEAISYDPERAVWRATVGGWNYEADALVLACGGQSVPESGSDGSGYALARMAGHSVTRLAPVLTGLTSPDPDLHLASGARTRARVRLLAEGSVLAEEEGELQWTDDGLSGIAVFQLSRFAARLLSREDLGAATGAHPAVPSSVAGLALSVDLAPDRSGEEIAAACLRMQAHAGGALSLRQLLSAFTHERVAAYLERRTAAADEEDMALAEQVACILKQLTIPINGTRGYERAQLTAGGISLREIDPETLASRLVPGLYFAGEILDVDAPCGGFNLQWAWSGGYVAGTAAGASPA